MSIRAVAASGLLLGLLAACGPGAPKEGQASIDTKKGTATINLGGGSLSTIGIKAPDNLPPYAQVYPGAEVKSAVTGIGGGPGSGMLALGTADSADQVLAFYKKGAAAAGLKTETDSTMGQLRSFVARDGERTLNLTLAPQGAQTFAQITYK